MLALATLTGMEGHFDDARQMVARGRAIAEDVGFKVLTAAYSSPSGYVEMLAGDPHAAERELREAGYRILEQMGEKGFLSTIAAESSPRRCTSRAATTSLSDSPTWQGLGPVDDLATQVEWRGTRARLLAGREAERAISLRNEAVALASETDYLNLQDALLHLAEVLTLGGRVGEAPSRLRRGPRDLRTQGERRLGRTGRGDDRGGRHRLAER